MVYILPISLWDCLTSYTGGSPSTYLLSALAFPVFFLIFFPCTLRNPTQPTQHELYPNANDPGTLLRVSRPGGSRVIKAHSLDNYPSFMHGNLPSSDAALLYKCLIKDLYLPKKSNEGLWKSWHLLYPRLTFFSLLPGILFITPREWFCNSLCVLQ